MKLNNNALNQLQGVRLPEYDRATTRAGIVHLGVGAFHRAHQAWYTEAVMNRFGGDWRIIGVSLKRPVMREQLDPQDSLYSLVTCRDDEVECQIIGALADVLVAPEDPRAVLAALAAPDIHVVTLTITEKGYGLDAANGKLDTQQSDIAHDLANPNTPRSALGFLANALAMRRTTGCGGLTLMSCDNLSHNGDKLRAALLQFIEHRDSSLAEWVATHCTFPNTMVDRIVPAITVQHREDFAREFGFKDSAPVFTEPFSQWVIEHKFAGPVPAWENVGAQLVDDVAPFEAAKLRTLNASHSLIAYLGCLSDCDTVADAMQSKPIRQAVTALMAETEKTFVLPKPFSVRNYQADLITRFDNRALLHRCDQIAMDGSQKIPQRIVPVIEWYIQRGEVPQHSCGVIAAWFAFLRSGQAINDPMANNLLELQNLTVEKALDTLLNTSAIFPQSIAGHEGVRECILNALNSL